MKKCFIVIILFLTLGVEAQPPGLFSKLIALKTSHDFIKYLDSLPSSNIEMLRVREVLPGYEEGIIKAMEIVNSNDRKGRNRVNNYQVDFLTDERVVFYCRILETDYDAGLEPPIKDVAADYIKDINLYKGFETSFENTYRAKLNNQELFETGVVFGNNCGYAASPPFFKRKIDSLIDSKNVKAIRYWLTSPNTERQLYALYAYGALQNDGYSLTKEEKTIINIIRSKKGSVETCDGCIHSENSIKGAIDKIDDLQKYWSYKGEVPKNKGSQNALWLLLICVIALLLTPFARKKLFKTSRE